MPDPTADFIDPTQAAAFARQAALKLQFDAVGLADVRQGWPASARLAEWLEAGHHASMEWMQTHAARRSHPLALWPEAKSAVLVGLNYGPDDNPLERLKATSNGVISAYAQGRDYHDVLKGRLKLLGAELARGLGAQVKVFVDTAPLMEKPLAERAGLGWQGKHTNLVSRSFGSWLLLGSVLLDVELTPDAAEQDHCGTCRACLDICPTDAFPAPYQLDARRCIAYLTIEHNGPIDRQFRTAIGSRVYGCDDCLAVCPWNKFASLAAEQKFHASPATDTPALAELLTLDDAAFRQRFAGTPIKRTGRDRFLRNVLIAAGNSGDQALVPDVLARLDDAAPVVRGMAVWALLRLAPERAAAEKAQRHHCETDADVRGEWADVKD
jgi:epoxyqueuosine reductase